MQKTRFKKFLEALDRIINPILSDSWTKRSILLISLLFGFYITNSFLSYLLDKSVNTVIIAIVLLIFMEISIRSLLLTSFSKMSIIIMSINNVRIGSTYALILEAFKLGS